MKKLGLFFSIFAAGTTFASLPIPCKVTAPSYCGNFLFGVTGLYWRSTVGQTDYAQIFHDGDLVLGLSDNHFVNVNHHYDWGFKANVGYLFPCSATELDLTYTNYNHHQRDFVALPAGEFLEPTLASFDDFFTDFHLGAVRLDSINFPAITTLATLVTVEGNISTIVQQVPPQTHVLDPPLILFPAAEIAVFAPPPTLASATARLDHHAFDLDLKQHTTVGCRSDFNWFAGLRYAHIDHKLNATYTANDHALVTGTATADITGALDDGTLTVTIGDDVTVLPADTIFDATVTANLDLDVASNFRQIIDQHSRFQGIGPRVGVGGTYQFANGIGIAVELSSSLLVGNVRNNLNENFVIDSTATVVNLDIHGVATVTSSGIFDEDVGVEVGVLSPIALDSFGVTLPVIDPETHTLARSFSQNDDIRVVPNIDFKLGLAFTGNFVCSNGKYRAEIGYLASHYFNAQDRLSAAETAFSTRHVFDTSFEGPYLSICFAL